MTWAFRVKYWQFHGIPQGINWAVGPVTLFFGEIGHNYYTEHPHELQEYAPIRWLDDSMI